MVCVMYTGRWPVGSNITSMANSKINLCGTWLRTANCPYVRVCRLWGAAFRSEWHFIILKLSLPALCRSGDAGACLQDVSKIPFP